MTAGGDGQEGGRPRGVGRRGRRGRGTAEVGSATEPERGVRIRPMTRGDVPAVIAIERSSFATPWTESTFRSLLERKGTGLWVAVTAAEREEVVGYAVVWAVLEQAELGNVAVAEAFRRRGLATRLVHAVVDWLRVQGVRELYLEVRESNAAARALYQGLGFRPIGRRKGYYSRPREDALVLRRPVRDAPEGLTD